MKTTFAIFLSSVVLSQAALIPLGISPAGTSAAIGLSPTNEVPPLTGSGAGGVAPAGVTFDEDNFTLNLNVGFGSAAGFTDLTGPATGAGIFGPAQTNQTAPELYDLAGITFLATNPAAGGIITGDVVFATNDVADLLAGNDYLDIATSNNPTGEIRGQLVPLDLPPSLTCPAPATVGCDQSTTLIATVADQVGNSLDVIWAVNGVDMATNAVPASTPPAPTNVSFTVSLPLGTNSITITTISTIGSSNSCGTTVTVANTNPPVIVSAAVSRSMLWPPNHNMVPITVTAMATDACGSVTWKIIRVQCNEAVNAKGSGHTAPDWQILGPHRVALRAERAGPGNGRIYTITIQAIDSSGNLSATYKLYVTVPHSQGHGKGQTPAALR